MKPNTLKKLCCPFDKSPLELTSIAQTTEGDVLEGFLYCPECKRIYPIVRGIPIMNPDEYREPQLEQPLMERWQPYLKGKEVSNFRLKSTDIQQIEE